MLTETLTGRTSHRTYKPLFRKIVLVLMVEVHKEGYEPDSHGDGRDIDVTYWRDAKASDLLIGEA
jgi:hypothetical protein